jgi:hypothetical protein
MLLHAEQQAMHADQQAMHSDEQLQQARCKTETRQAIATAPPPY